MNDIVTLEISDVVYRGKGLARLEGQVFFVPATAAGETVTARVVHKAKNYSEARLIEVLSPSPRRVKPACPLAQTAEDPAQPERLFCPGCVYQHIAYEEELKLKHAQLCGFIERIAKADRSVCAVPVQSPSALHYRNKIVLHVAQPPAGAALGYIAEDNVTVIDTPACPLAQQSLCDLLSSLRAKPDFAASLLPARRLTLRCGADGKALHWTGKPAADAPAIVESAAFGQISVPCGSFYQVNPKLADELVRLIMGVISEIQPAAVLDLYAGVGVFGLAAASVGVPAVFGADTDRSAIQSEERNAREMGLDNARFMTQSAVDAFKGCMKGLHAEDTLVVVDPPRTGLEKDILRALCGAKPATIAYVSCAADTMARDASSLITAGYQMTSSRVLDMFPRTPYFESLTVFRRDKASTSH